MMISKLLILPVFLLTIIITVTAQTHVNTNIQQFTTENGLPSNGIKGLQWDEETGFLWMSTEAGIVRFNGVDFRSYTKQNMPVIASERMLFMIRNNVGKIYTSDQQGNIFLIEKSKPVLWRKARIAHGPNPDLNHHYLLGVSDTLFLTKINTQDNSHFAPAFNTIAGISDTSCIIQKNNSLFYFSISMNKAYRLPFEDANSLSLFKIGKQLFVMNDKKQFYNIALNEAFPGNSSFTLVPASLQNNKTSSVHWQNGMTNPVFVEDDKAWILNYNGNSITTELICDNFPPDSYIASVQYSKKNNLLFVGTESKGLIVINQNKVQSKKRNYISKNRNSYYSQIELENGNILTNEGDVIGDNYTDTGKLPIKARFSFSISQTDDNTIWYTQLEKSLRTICLHRYDKTTGDIRIYPKIKRGDIIAVSGGKFYSANLDGIGVINADSLLFLYRYPQSLAGTVLFDVQEIQPGVLAIASCAGLLRFNIATNKLDTIFSKDNFCVRSIWKYKDYVFFGTYGSGFYVYHNGAIKPMPLDKNSYLLYTHCFVPDDNGYCWISTNRGLFKSKISELIAAFENKNSTVYYHYFGKKDGMEMTELNGGCAPCALSMKNGTISFPSMDGLLWVDPKKAVPILPAGEIFIDEIMLNNEKINIDSINLKKLPSQTQEIVLGLGYSAWCNKENIYIDYQLNDTVIWKPVNTGDEALIRLSNLRSGNYVLRIRKLNGFGINNYTYKILKFTITTPWYKQWWFYALCLLALLGISQLFFNIRTRQYKIRQRKLEKQVAQKTKELQDKNEILEKNNGIKTRLISIISHDIVTPLKFVTVAGKNLIENRGMMPEELQLETIQEMTNTSQELQLLSTNILNWIKYQNENRRQVKDTFNLHELVNQVIGVLNSLAKQKGLALDNRINANLEIYQFFEPLKILVYNLMTNALNFSEKGSVIISGEEKDGYIILHVSDEGVGMTPDQIKNIMADQFIISSANMDNRKGNGIGYLIIKDLLKIMGASLHIESEKNVGTKISVTLPSIKTNTTSAL